jgi:membrane protein implicated in regulation of membrane protease activity
MPAGFLVMAGLHGPAAALTVLLVLAPALVAASWVTLTAASVGVHRRAQQGAAKAARSERALGALGNLAQNAVAWQLRPGLMSRRGTAMPTGATSGRLVLALG